MSEVVSRPSASRGRGSGRGGRGGFAGRGGRRANGDKADTKSAPDGLGAFDDEGDIAELRQKYGDKTSVIREMFPDWSEIDVLFALQETNGDENDAVTRIAEGTVSQWGEVSKTKKSTRPKAKDTTDPAASNIDSSSAGARSSRGGRIASEGGRGRGRATERGGRGGRARVSQSATNGGRGKEAQPLSVPTEESSAWTGDKLKTDAVEAKRSEPEKTAMPVDAPKPASSQAKTWASMLRQSAVPKQPPIPKEAPIAKPMELTEEPPAAASSHPEVEQVDNEAETTPVAQQAVPAQAAPIVEQPPATLLPSKDELTETNLEQVVDDSKPPATDTAASTAADSWDPRQSPASASVTPISAAHQQHQAQRPAASGFAASAIKATAERTARTPSYQRRVLDQEEAVRMPGNHQVDRAAVQFGAFSLNDSEEDVDGEREEPETRAQPPADSPVAHPRASLPPTAHPVAVPEAFSQKPIVSVPPGMAPAGTVEPNDGSLVQSANVSAAPSAPAAHATQRMFRNDGRTSQLQNAHEYTATQQAIPNAQQYGRFGHAGPQDASVAAQKPLDPFSQQTTAASQPPLDNFSTQTSQPQAQHPGGAFSSAPSDYSNYYTANQQERNPYNFYGQHFGQQQAAHGQHDGVAQSQQRPFAGYNASQTDNLSQYPQSGAAHSQPRFGGANDSQNSGHSTPNPTAQAQQQQQPQQQQAAAAAAAGSQQSHGQQYPGFNHPYYSNPYYHQYYSGYGQGGFGPYGKGGGGMYGQPYGVSPNAPYEHVSSPGTFGPSSLHRDSALGSGLGEYGRAGSAQATNQPALGGSSFGSVHDSFSRGASSFQSQGQAFGGQGQPAGVAGDDMKPFGDSKAASGPSPALGGPRPGSATSNVPGAQSGLPPPQTSQMGGAYGGYPNHLQQQQQQQQQGHGIHGSGAYGMGAGAGATQHGSSPYGSYGQGFGSGGYYGGGQQQQRGGWGGNYH